MPDEETPVTFSYADYDAIEAAVMETARGRWFLREYARRNRNADTEAVLAAVAGLEKKIVHENTASTMGQIRASLEGMVSAIEETKADIGPFRADDAGAALAETGVDQEETARRIVRILKTLRYLEERIHTMMALCGPERPEENEAALSCGMADLAQAPAGSVFLN